MSLFAVPSKIIPAHSGSCVFHREIYSVHIQCPRELGERLTVPFGGQSTVDLYSAGRDSGVASLP